MVTDPKNRLHGLSVLIVEDEYYLASDLFRYLADNDAVVLGPVGDIEGALRLIEANSPDIAIVDINLGGDWATPVIEALRTRDVPFVIASGYTDRVIGQDLGQLGSVEKPYRLEQLMTLIDSAVPRPG